MGGVSSLALRYESASGVMLLTSDTIANSNKRPLRRFYDELAAEGNEAFHLPRAFHSTVNCFRCCGAAPQTSASKSPVGRVALQGPGAKCAVTRVSGQSR